MKHELHILVGCADARDLSQVQIDAVNSVSREFAENGIKIHFRVIRAAGSFITKDVYQDIRYLVMDFQREQGTDPADTSLFIHIQGHGHLLPECSGQYVRNVNDLHIVEGSPLNCGMLGAASVAVEIEALINEAQLRYTVVDRSFQVGVNAGIRDLMRDIYAHDGYLAGDWIRSIDLLRAHPRTQKARLEADMAQDPELKRFRYGVTAGIQDYHRHALVRVDNGFPEAPFWDDVQTRIRTAASTRLADLHAQAEKQKPLAGLLCMADPRATSRMDAAKFYRKYRNLESGDGYLPNTIFNMTGSTFDIPGTPFGPYVIAGFFYAVKHLNLTDQMVMGRDVAQSDRILLKIKHDPIMNLIVKTFSVNLIPINQQAL